MVLQLRLSATVAPYIDAIKEKRAAGWRWADIRKALNVDCTDRGFGQAVRRCTWKAEQLPLPQPVQQKNVKSVNASSIVQNAENNGTVNRRPLPSVTRKIGDGSKDDRLARLKALGIDVSTMEDEE